MHAKIIILSINALLSTNWFAIRYPIFWIWSILFFVIFCYIASDFEQFCELFLSVFYVMMSFFPVFVFLLFLFLNLILIFVSYLCNAKEKLKYKFRYYRNIRSSVSKWIIFYICPLKQLLLFCFSLVCFKSFLNCH